MSETTKRAEEIIQEVAEALVMAQATLRQAEQRIAVLEPGARNYNAQRIRAEVAEARLSTYEATIRQVEQTVRETAEWVRRTKGDPGWKVLTQWHLDLERQADALRAICDEARAKKGKP